MEKGKIYVFAECSDGIIHQLNEPINGWTEKGVQKLKEEKIEGLDRVITAIRTNNHNHNEKELYLLRPRDVKHFLIATASEVNNMYRVEVFPDDGVKRYYESNK